MVITFDRLNMDNLKCLLSLSDFSYRNHFSLDEILDTAKYFYAHDQNDNFCLNIEDNKVETWCEESYFRGEGYTLTRWQDHFKIADMTELALRRRNG